MRLTENVRAEKLTNQQAAGFVNPRIAAHPEDRPSIETWPRVKPWLGDTLKDTHILKPGAECSIETELSLAGGALHLSVHLYTFIDGVTQFSVPLAADGVPDDVCAMLNTYGLPAGTVLQNLPLSLYDLAWAIADAADYEVEVNTVGEPWADKFRFTLNLPKDVGDDNAPVLQGDTAQAGILIEVAAQETEANRDPRS